MTTQLPKGAPAARARWLLVIVLSLLGLVAATFAARGPAVAEQTSYHWPPSTLPAGHPSRTWFTPLLVARQFADRIDFMVPCGRVVPLDSAGSDVVLIATTRGTPRWNGVAVTQSARTRRVTVRAGGRTLDRFVPPAGAPCVLRLAIRRDAWAVDRPGRNNAEGRLPHPPGIYGLFSEVDLRRTRGMSVTVVPLAQDTRPTTAQTVLRGIAGILVVCAIGLALFSASRRPRRHPVRLTLQDGLVVSILFFWWLFAPLQDDDGWVRARQTNSLVSGGFSNYYEHWGANFPLSAWWEWLQHFDVARTSGLAIHRLPSLTALLLLWLVCRAALGNVLRRGPSRGDITWWSATLVFATGAVSFGFTLRPEPELALLAGVSLYCALRFLNASSPTPLLIALLASCLAVTIHPAGLVAIAPLALCLPTVIRRARRRDGVTLLSLGGVIAIGVATTMLLVFIDFDVESRRTATGLIESGGHNYGLLSEWVRYSRLAEYGASPLRRETVALMLLSAASALALWRARTSLATRLPALSVAVSLAILCLTPSKWIWHFGTQIGFVAVAIGVAVEQLRCRQLAFVWRCLVAAGLLGVGLWATRGYRWGPFDTMSVDWSRVPYASVMVGAAAAAILIAHIVRRRGGWRPELAVLPAVLITLLALTGSALATDAARTDGWTVAKQTLSSVVGRDACGLASDLRVPLPTSMTPLSAFDGSSDRGVAHPDGGLTGGSRRIPRWYAVGNRPIGFDVGGAWNGDVRVHVTWGRRESQGVRPLRSGWARLGQALPGLVRSERRFVAEGSLPGRPPRANAVSVQLDRPVNATTHLWAPVAYTSVGVEALVRSPSVHELVSPFLFEAVPCARPPALVYGIAAPPSMLIDWSFGNWTPLGNYSSPFLALSEVFDLRRLPIERWQDSRTEIQVHWVGPNAGDAFAPASRKRT